MRKPPNVERAEIVESRRGGWCEREREREGGGAEGGGARLREEQNYDQKFTNMVYVNVICRPNMCTACNICQRKMRECCD